MNKTNSPHPQWALKHKKPGTELRLLNGRYYLYEYKTHYDQVKKGPRKKTGALLGSITQEHGFVPSKKRMMEGVVHQKVFAHVRVKEYGVSWLVLYHLKQYCDVLKKSFGEDWKNLIAIAYCRFLYRCPLKSIPFHLATSYLSEGLGIDSFTEKQASGILNRIGDQRDRMIDYMRAFIQKGDYVLMDATNVISHSQNISLSKQGYSNNLSYDSQFNLLYLYSSQNRMPVYYRLLAGNIREVKAFKNSILEAGLDRAVIIADKGFYSERNIELLFDEKLQFIIPLKRDNSMIDYQAMVNNTFKQSASYFEHEKKSIWYRKTRIENGLYLHLFLNELLRVKEDSDYLTRIKTHPESYSIDGYHEKRNRFGTLALLTNLKDSDQVIYQIYKSRLSIELMFDGMKNVLEADHTYMQNEQTLQGWMFINHITLQWYQHLYIDLKDKGLLNKISVNDYVQHLTDIKKIYINEQWHFNEFTNYTKKLTLALSLNIDFDQ